MNSTHASRLLALAPFLACVIATPAAAQEAASATESAVERRQERARSVFEQQGLTGGWFGADPWLTDRGIDVELVVTVFGQDPWAGAGDTGAELGGKFDGLFKFDLDKLGLWPGLGVTPHPEYNFGDGLRAPGGVLLPVNIAMQLPGTDGKERVDLSSLFLTQRLGETFSLIAGKTNLADVAALHPYAGGAGISGFMNAGLAAAPTGVTPPYVYGAIVAAKTKRAVFTLGVYGGTGARGELDFANAFHDGFLLGGGVAVPVRPSGLPGVQSFSFLWGDRDADFANVGDILLPGGIQAVGGADTRRYSLSYSFHQELGRFAGSEGRGWGVWGRATLNDDELSAVAWSVAGGIGGDVPFSRRGRDRWGIGLFHYELSSLMKNPAVVPLPLGGESGVELFYNARLSEWLRLSGDLQLVSPALQGADPVVVGGLRLSVRL